MDQIRDLGIAEALRDAIKSVKYDINVSLPARVTAFYPWNCADPTKGKNCVDVQPLIKNRVVQDDGTVVAQSETIITNVPVEYPGGNGFRIQWDLAPGDIVRLVFSHRALETWLTAPAGQEVDPVDPRTHHLTDAIAVPGLMPFSSPWAGDGKPSIGNVNGPRIAFTDAQIELGGNTDAVALASKLTGPTGALSELLTVFSGWTPVPGDGGAALKGALSILIAEGWPADVSSTKVKAGT